MMTTQGDNFVINELIREYLEWNGCGNAADVLVCEDGFSFVGFLCQFYQAALCSQQRQPGSHKQTSKLRLQL